MPKSLCSYVNYKSCLYVKSHAIVFDHQIHKCSVVIKVLYASSICNGWKIFVTFGTCSIRLDVLL